MELTLIRHAIAVDRSPARLDAARPLTDEGRARFHDEVRGLAALGFAFDRLLHSPMLRAVQTAELAARLVDGETIVTTLLAQPPMTELLAAFTGEHVAAVGHSPWLEQLAAWLVLGDAGLGARFVVKKGGVLCLSGIPQPGQMQLTALIAPRMLRPHGG